ncbi:MAG: hypothetical protein IT195_00195 [Microthrixaceae bacterium]|nr:hypothetical protein [Microthrixaceae bacterium]
MHRGGDRISGGDGIMRPDTPAALFAKLGLSVCRPAHADHTFAAVSSRGTRTFLVPVDSNVLATASLTLHNGLRPPPMRVMRRVLGTAFRAGLAGPLLRAGGRVVGVTRGPENLLDVIEHRLGVSHLTFAATTGAPGPFATPVLQLVDAAGKMVAFAKVGWDEVTRELVENEARVLARAHDDDAVGLETPQLHCDFRWRDLAVTLTHPLPAGLRRVKSGAAPASYVTEAVARMGDTISVHPIRESAMYARWLAGCALDTAHADLLARALDIAEPFGSVEVRHGRWHGDWVAWNMARAAPEALLHVWDWEYSAAGVPVGLDILHFHFQYAYVEKGTDARGSFAYATRSAATDLARIGLGRSEREAAALCHRLELLRREVWAASLGGDPDSELMSACALQQAELPSL